MERVFGLPGSEVSFDRPAKFYAHLARTSALSSPRTDDVMVAWAVQQ